VIKSTFGPEIVLAVVSLAASMLDESVDALSEGDVKAAEKVVSPERGPSPEEHERESIATRVKSTIYRYILSFPHQFLTKSTVPA
jgi:hypothetical protein